MQAFNDSWHERKEASNRAIVWGEHLITSKYGNLRVRCQHENKQSADKLKNCKIVILEKNYRGKTRKISNAGNGNFQFSNFSNFDA
jgi:hypothetical protein